MAKNSQGQIVTDQRINVNRHSRMLSVGKHIPPDFELVRVTKTSEGVGFVVLLIRKLTVQEA